MQNNNCKNKNKLTNEQLIETQSEMMDRDLTIQTNKKITICQKYLNCKFCYCCNYCNCNDCIGDFIECIVEIFCNKHNSENHCDCCNDCNNCDCCDDCDDCCDD